MTFRLNPITGKPDMVSDGSGGGIPFPPGTPEVGDLLVWNGTQFVYLPVGADGYILTANSEDEEGIEWLPPIDLHAFKVIFGDLTNGANYDDLQAAIDASPAGTVIGIQTGDYDIGEIQLKDGVSFSGLSPRGGAGNATVFRGKFFDGGGFVNSNFYNIRFETDGDFYLELTGSFVSLFNCDLQNLDHTGISVGIGCTVNAFNCNGNLFTTGIEYWEGLGVFITRDSMYSNSGASVTSSIVGGVIINDCSFACPLYPAGSNTLTIRDSTVNCQPLNIPAIITSTTAHAEISTCNLFSGTASAISVGSGTTVDCLVSTINSSNAIAITGAGTLRSAGLIFEGASSTVNVATQIPLVASNDAVKVVTPSAYPYTVQPQDAVVKIDTSAARVVNLPASPVSGQKVSIKDTVGSAGSNNITINPASGNIDGSSSYIININYGFVDLKYTGTEWSILSQSSSGGSYSSLAPFIVGSSFADYATIQDGINAAVLAGATTSNPLVVEIKAKSTPYTENLTLAPGIFLVGRDGVTLGDQVDPYSGTSNSVKIIGTHTIPADTVGKMKVYNLQLEKDDGIIYAFSDCTGSSRFIIEHVGCTVAPLNDEDETWILSAGAFADPVLTFTDCQLTGEGGYFDDAFLHADVVGVTITTSYCHISLNDNSSTLKGFIYYDGEFNNYTSAPRFDIEGTATFAFYERNSSIRTINWNIENLLDSSFTNCHLAIGQLNVITGNRPYFVGCAFDPQFTISFGGLQGIFNDCSGVCGYKKVATAITSAYSTLVTDNFVPVDTTGGAVAITLCTTPFAGMTQTIKDIGGAAGSANITIIGNIDTNAGGATISTNFDSITLTYNDTITTWMIS